MLKYKNKRDSNSELYQINCENNLHFLPFPVEVGGEVVGLGGQEVLPDLKGVGHLLPTLLHVGHDHVVFLYTDKELCHIFFQVKV